MKVLFITATIGSLATLIAFSTPNHNTGDATVTRTPAVVCATDGNAPNKVIKARLQLTGSQEVPANNSTAKGTANVAYDKTSHMLSYTVSWKGLSGPATMAHIHGPAPKGANAGVKHDLTGLLQKAPSGKFTDSVMVDGSALQEDSLLAGLYYINIHTAAHPGGEIRAQIELPHGK